MQIRRISAYFRIVISKKFPTLKPQSAESTAIYSAYTNFDTSVSVAGQLRKKVSKRSTENEPEEEFS